MPDSFTRRLGGDHGFMIVEVLVSALILLMVSAAVFTTLDKADQVAGGQQKRTLGANFAQSELERIRSLPVEDIAAMRGTRTITRDKIVYTITTDAKWVSDGGDEPECSTRTGGLDYMRLTVKVSWSNMGNAKPVSMTTLFTPSAGAGGGETGSLSIHLTNAKGLPVPGVAISANGPQDYTATTNANGCVVFGFIPAAQDPGYEVSFSRTGYVDGQSNSNVKVDAGVIGGETTKLQFDYDVGGTTKVANFYTRRAIGSDNRSATGPTEDIPTAPTAFQLYHNEQPSPGITIPLDGSQTSWDGTARPLFPFSSPYAVYAGDCPKNAVPSGDSDSKFVNITSSLMQSAGNVYVPALDVKVYSGSSASSPGIPIKATVQVNAECNMIWSRDTVANDTTINGRTTYAGHLIDPGFPYSAGSGSTPLLQVCAYTKSDIPNSPSTVWAARELKSAIQLKFNKNLQRGTAVDIYMQAPGNKPRNNATTCMS